MAAAETLTIKSELDDETRELLKKPASLGDKLIGSKKFIMSLTVVVCGTALAAYTYDPETPDFAMDVVKWTYGAGAGGIAVTFLQDWLKIGSKKGEG